MHPNPAYRDVASTRNIAFARARAFGVLAVNADGGPLISHIPFVLDRDGGSLELHLVRSNPIVRACAEPLGAVIAVSGPDSYVSPDWYDVADQVPTWNYVAVHLRGRLKRMDPSDMHPVLNRLSAEIEPRLAPKTPWTTDKMTPEVLDRMMRQVVPFRMAITAIDGTWKLSQNKADEVRLRAADGVQASGIGTGLADLARLMRDPPDRART